MNIQTIQNFKKNICGTIIKTLRKMWFLMMLCLVPMTAFSQNPVLKIPVEVEIFIEDGMTAIALETADLNGDGTKDYILVTEKSKPQLTDDFNDDLRSLIILTRDKSGKLKLTKRNEKVVYCRSCGGAFGDPFAGIEVKRNSFTVNNYGGSAWRWSESYQFNYSRRDKTWQLVKVAQESFNALEPNKVKNKVFTPKKFGKIDIADFDPSVIGKSK